jgi:hypothetical protein
VLLSAAHRRPAPIRPPCYCRGPSCPFVCHCRRRTRPLRQRHATLPSTHCRLLRTASPVLLASSALLSSKPMTSTRRRRALRADEPLFAQTEGDIALKAYVSSACFRCFRCCVYTWMLQQRYCTYLILAYFFSTSPMLWQWPQMCPVGSHRPLCAAATATPVLCVVAAPHPAPCAPCDRPHLSSTSLLRPPYPQCVVV